MLLNFTEIEKRGKHQPDPAGVGDDNPVLSWSCGSADQSCCSRATQQQQDRGGAGENSFSLRLQTKNTSHPARAKVLTHSSGEAQLLAGDYNLPKGKSCQRSQSEPDEEQHTNWEEKIPLAQRDLTHQFPSRSVVLWSINI